MKSTNELALQKVRDFLEAGNREALIDILGSDLTINTVYNWIKNPESIQKSYKSQILVSVAEKIEIYKSSKSKNFPNQGKKRHIIYENMLNEMMVDAATQSPLEEFSGVYRIFHEASDLNFDTIVLNYERSPVCASFWMRYRYHLNNYLCDGLIFLRSGKIFFTGLSASSMFVCHLERVYNPKKNHIIGSFSLVDFSSGDVIESNCILVSNKLNISKKDKEAIYKYLAGSVSD